MEAVAAQLLDALVPVDLGCRRSAAQAGGYPKRKHDSKREHDPKLEAIQSGNTIPSWRRSKAGGDPKQKHDSKLEAIQSW